MCAVLCMGLVTNIFVILSSSSFYTRCGLRLVSTAQSPNGLTLAGQCCICFCSTSLYPVKLLFGGRLIHVLEFLPGFARKVKRILRKHCPV